MGRAAALALVVAAATTATATAAPGAAGAATGPPGATTAVAVAYTPPVDRPPVDRFRPPPSPYGAGNRGVDYVTAPGTAVRAAAAGLVSFAGRIGADSHVVVLHADGIRTSYSFLASATVRRGQAVAAGDTVGTAGPSLHFGARAGDAYVDPLVLLAGDGTSVVRLVPDDRWGMGSEEQERSLLRGLLRGARRGVELTAEAAAWVAGETAEAAADAATGALAAGMSLEELRVWVPAAVSTLSAPVRITRSGVEWWLRRDGCTSAGVAPPPPAGRRRVVLVAGLASRSTHDAVDDVDTAALGYAGTDRVRFSYRGGTVAEQAYEPADTQVDIHQSGERLRRLLERLHAEEPGVPIDIVAHSMGGLVARAALGERAPPGVERLTTLGTPHQGADIATGIALTGLSRNGELALRAVSVLAQAGAVAIDPMSPAVGQLAETSDFIRDLNDRPPPPGVTVTSIAARTDAMVAAPRSYLAGATNVVVSVPGLVDHSGLPGSDAARREMALALAGMGPGCESFWDFFADAVVGEGIGTAEDAIGGWVAWQARGAGARDPAPGAPGRAPGTHDTRPR